MNRFDGCKRWNWLAVMMVLALAPVGWAQLQPRQDPQRMMADQLHLLMHDALAGEAARPTPDQLTRAQVLLNMALELSPADADLWRAQVEIAGWRQDDRRRREAIGRLVQLEPSNDTAQLELIMASVAERQTLDERLKMIRRILDASASTSLSTALRSRLASYAAAAAREMGDIQAFSHRLAQAVRLDPTNADAARMIYELALQRDDAPLYRGTALIGWVRAAPADPVARYELGELLLREALFEQAANQFQMSVALSIGVPQTSQVRLWATALAMAGQADAALNVLNQVEQATRAVQGEGQSNGLAPELELVRAAIGSVGPGLDGNKPSFDRLRASLAALSENGSAAARQELAVASAMFSDELDAALQLVDQEGVEPATGDLVRGWVALRYGRHTEGRELLHPLAQENDLAALGLALLEQDVEARASMLETIRRRDPTGIAGLLAVMNLHQSSRATPPTRVGVSLRDLMGRSSARLWHTDLAFSPWLSMRLRVDPMRPGYLEPLRATAVLHNLSGEPLNLTGTIPTQMLVTVTTRDIDGREQSLAPRVVDIGRRLTLDTGERLTVEFRLDRGELGEILTANPSVPITIQASAIVDPRTTVTGAVRSGPIGAMDRVRSVQTANVPATSTNLDRWLSDMGSADGAQQLRGIARLLRALTDDPGGEAASRQQEIGDAIAKQWETFGPLQKAWTMRFLPPESHRPAGLRRVVDLAQRSDDPLIRVVYLATQVTDVQSPVMTAALRHRDPTIGEFARALRDSMSVEAQPR